MKKNYLKRTSGMITTCLLMFGIFQANAQSGAAINFDGVNDYIAVGDNSLLNFGTGDFSIEASFKGTVSQINYAGLVDKAQYTTTGAWQGWQFDIVNNHIAAEFTDGPNFLGVANGLQGTTLLNDGNWHHLSMVVSRSTNNIKLYVDGNIEANVTNTLVSTINITYTTAMLIGVDRTQSFYIKGNEDEVRIWNRALCQGEIQNNINGELPLPQNGLVAYYKFNQGISGGNNSGVLYLDDASGNTQYGAFENMALSGTTSNFVSPGSVTSGSNAPIFANPTLSVSGNQSICMGLTTTLAANGSVSTYTWNTTATSVSVTISPTVTTSYSVTGTNSLGCVSNTAVATVTVNALPTVTITSNPATAQVCTGSSTTLTASGANTYTWNTGTTTASISVSPTTNTSYTVSGKNTNGCVNTKTVSITVNAPPILSANSTSSVLCAGQTATITANGANTYTWSTSSTSATIAISPSVTTNYTLTGTNSNGCTSMQVITQSVSICTGINDIIGMQNTLRLYPNPSNAVFILELNTETEVTITNVLGSIVYKENLVEGKHPINLEKEANGIYLMSAKSNNSSRIIKLMKQD